MGNITPKENVHHRSYGNNSIHPLFAEVEWETSLRKRITVRYLGYFMNLSTLSTQFWILHENLLCSKKNILYLYHCIIV